MAPDALVNWTFIIIKIVNRFCSHTRTVNLCTLLIIVVHVSSITYREYSFDQTTVVGIVVALLFCGEKLRY